MRKSYWCLVAVLAMSEVSVHAMDLSNPHGDKNTPWEDPAFQWKQEARALVQRGNDAEMRAWFKNEKHDFVEIAAAIAGSLPQARLLWAYAERLSDSVCFGMEGLKAKAAKRGSLYSTLKKLHAGQRVDMTGENIDELREILTTQDEIFYIYTIAGMAKLNQLKQDELKEDECKSFEQFFKGRISSRGELMRYLDSKYIPKDMEKLRTNAVIHWSNARWKMETGGTLWPLQDWLDSL